MTGLGLLRFAAYAAAVLLSALGIFLLVAYIAGAIEVLVEDAADKSWLYWGLALAFFGVIVLATGIGLAWWSWQLGKQSQESSNEA